MLGAMLQYDFRAEVTADALMRRLYQPFDMDSFELWRYRRAGRQPTSRYLPYSRRKRLRRPSYRLSGTTTARHSLPGCGQRKA